MGRRQRPPPTKEECRRRLAEAMWAFRALAPLVMTKKRLTPRRLYDELDGVIGRLAEVQQTLITRSRIRPKTHYSVRDEGPRPDLWWPRYWKLVKEMKDRGVNLKSPEGAEILMPLASEIFD